MNRNEQSMPRTGYGVYSRPSAQIDADGTLVVRASAAGDCRRALWYSATGHEVTNPPSDGSLTVMEAGNALEPVVLRAMERAGWSVTPADSTDPQQVAVQLGPKLRITGHPDATGRMSLFDDEMVVEVKTRGPAAFKRWRTLGAERSHPEAVAQAALYTLGLFGEVRDAVIAAMDTGSREWDHEVIPADRLERSLETTAARLGELGAHHVLHGADPDALPDRDFPAGHWRCRSCPFLDACLPGAQADPGEVEQPVGNGAEVTLADAQDAVEAYMAARQSVKEPDRVKRKALATLRAWMSQEGLTTRTFEGPLGDRKVSLVQSKRYSVDHRKLNALLDPETRAEIVTESASEYVRVS